MFGSVRSPDCRSISVNLSGCSSICICVFFVVVFFKGSIRKSCETSFSEAKESDECAQHEHNVSARR